MKTKILLFILGTAIVATSFVSTKAQKETPVKSAEKSVQTYNTEPVGGFISEDKL